MDNNGQRPAARPIQVLGGANGKDSGQQPASLFFLFKRNVILKVIVCLTDFCPIAAKDLIFKR